MIITILFILLVFSVMMLIKNDITYKYNAKIIDEIFTKDDYEKYLEYFNSISYHTQVLNLFKWKWTLDDFEKEYNKKHNICNYYNSKDKQ